jgi:hypothetical protein
MNNLIWVAIIILVFVIVYGYSRISTGIEIDTGEKNCRNRTSDDSILIEPMIDMICDSHCRPDLYTYRHGHTYHEWKCSNADTIVCVCNR